MSLKDELDRIRAEASANAKIIAAYEALVAQLGQAQTASRALKVGDSMPSFMLPNVGGRLVFSDELLAKGPVVVNFFRGDWCPYCTRTLVALEAALPRIAAAGGQLVALTPDTGRYFTTTRRAHRLSYEILSDVDGAVGMQFGVLFRVPELTREMLAGLGTDLAERHGNDGWLIPIPASYVVDRDGVIRYAFVDVDFTRRAAPDDIVAVLESLKG
jgi:peroxiredoxin